MVTFIRFSTTARPISSYFFSRDNNDIDDEIIDNLTWREAYAKGFKEPNHLPPAVIHVVHWHPEFEDSPYHNSITIWEYSRIICPHCGDFVLLLAGMVDFDFDRCADFHLMVGEYSHGYAIQAGQEAYLFEEQGSTLS